MSDTAESQKTAFTLAEVLITLGIIGIVAAMTIPALMNKTNDSEYRNAWKKIYSTFANATNTIMNENGGSVSGIITASDDTMRTQYEPYFNITKSCPEPNVKGICWHQDNTWYLYDGTTPVPDATAGLNGLLDAGPAGDVLADGTLVRYLTWACPPGTVCGYILVDVNGFKKPNVIGRDIYGARLYPDKLRPFGSPSAGEGTTCTSADNGLACSAVALSK